MTISISPATFADLPEARAVLLGASAWLNSRGTPLWRPEDLSSETLAAHLADGGIRLARVDGVPAGTIILQDEDPRFWPEIPHGTSLYFHKLAVARAFAGKGVASALIAHAREEAKARGRSYLRMDCSARHPALRPFYERHGFRFVDQKVVEPWLVDRMVLHLV